MCGFVGTVARAPLDDEALAATRPLTDLLARRGPDDEGRWTHRTASFGFRRLAVIDPSPAGHQPMVTVDGRWVLMFNGEVYNFRDLRRVLEREGDTFRSDTDTEVVLRSLVRWGRRALERFDGMFALALYDSVSQTLLLARDPFGIKPLHWLDDRRGLVFSSQYDAVVRHPWCERQRLRADVAALYLRLGYVPSPYGIVERTGQLSPGSTAIWTPSGGLRVETYAQWPEPPDRYLDEPSTSEVVHDAVREAVRLQLVADVPVGTFLSGGVDSPLITAVSRLEQRHRIRAFTIGSDDPALDETAEARRYASMLDVSHVVHRFTERDALELVDDVIEAFGEPFADYSAFPTMLVSRLARRHVTVALSGDGGDELFFGYPRMWIPLRWRRLMHLPVQVRRALRKGLGRSARWRPPGAATLGSLGDWYSNSHSQFGGPRLAEVAPGLGQPPSNFDLYDLGAVPSAHDLAEWLRAVEIRGHLEKMLIKVDRSSMHESLEVRVPLLSSAVAGAARQVDPRTCMAGGLGKIPLRRTLGRYVPPDAVQGAKRGFEVPLGSWLRGPLGDRLRDRVVERPRILAEAFDRVAVRALVDQQQATGHGTQALWNLMTLQEWADRHLRPLGARSRAE